MINKIEIDETYLNDLVKDFDKSKEEKEEPTKVHEVSQKEHYKDEDKKINKRRNK